LKPFLQKYSFLLKVFVVWRLFLFLPLIIGYCFIPYRQGFEYTNIFSRTAFKGFFNNFLFWPWANFDGVHYLSIAGNGYTQDVRFFPLFPLFINITSRFVGQNMPFSQTQFLIALIFSSAFLFIGLIYFYKLILLDYDEKVAKRAIIFLLIFPTSFFFVAVYSESLFFLLAVLIFYFSRRKRWLISGVLGCLLSATRIVGVFIFPALVCEFAVSEKLFEKKLPVTRIFEFLSKGWALFLVPIGLVSYSFYNFQRYGDFLYFLKAQAELGNSRSVNSIVLFPQTLVRYTKILFSFPASRFEWWVALLELLTFFFVSFLFYLGWIKRVRVSYMIFAFFAFLIPVSSGTFSALPRYSIVLFPIFIVLSILLTKKSTVFYILSLSIQFLLLVFFSRGYFIS